MISPLFQPTEKGGTTDNRGGVREGVRKEGEEEEKREKATFVEESPRRRQVEALFILMARSYLSRLPPKRRKSGRKRGEHEKTKKRDGSLSAMQGGCFSLIAYKRLDHTV